MPVDNQMITIGYDKGIKEGLQIVNICYEVQYQQVV